MTKTKQKYEPSKKPGTRTVTTYSVQRSLLDGMDQFAQRVTKDSGFYLDRSKLMTSIAELLLEHAEKIDTTQITSLELLRKEIKRGICRKR